METGVTPEMSCIEEDGRDADADADADAEGFEGDRQCREGR